MGSCPPSSFAAPKIADRHSGLAGDTLLVVRHAEKPDKGSMDPGLTPAGEARARAYAPYFQHLKIEGVPVQIDALVATADSASSSRPRLTLAPLSQVMGLKIQQPFADDDVEPLAGWLASGVPHRTILIAWHHHKTPALLRALGADPAALLPDGAWPDDVFDWLIVLRYDEHGTLIQTRRIVEPPFGN